VRGYNAGVRLSRLAGMWLLVGWFFLALYPDPSMLVRSIENVAHPNIDPAAAQALAATLPNNPRLIEQAVLTRIIPYAYDWQVNGVPWYFPTTAEAIKAGRGDCESRAVVLASILKAKGIPFQLRMSFDHIWVQYPGKVANALENNSVVLAQRVNGHYVWHWPKFVNLRAEWHAQVAQYWTPMPLLRKALLFVGLALVLLINPVGARRWRRAGIDRAGVMLAVRPPARRSALLPRLRGGSVGPVQPARGR
jgi:hypothetical protein